VVPTPKPKWNLWNFQDAPKDIFNATWIKAKS